MLRDIDLKEISDGKLYSSNDLAKTDCGGCKGCSSCCEGMGSSIVLDPLDFYRILTKLGTTPEGLLSSQVELNVVDGLILPNLKMNPERDACSFLNEEGRCTIHDSRPGFCRMFPLGRFYENDSFQYFLQIHECPNKGKTKVKIKKWLDTPNLKTYEKYISDWHFFTKKLQDFILSVSGRDDLDEVVKNLSMYILKLFYLAPYSVDADFYEQFYVRLEKAMAATEDLL